MKCIDYQKWLHLNREGELSALQKSRLARHLHHCEVCSREKKKIEKAHRLIRIAGDTISLPSAPRQLTNSILNAVEREKAAEVETNRSLACQKISWIDRLRMPKIRFALAALGVVTIGVFLFQGALILHRISRLEKKIAVQSGRHSQYVSSTAASKQWVRAGIQRALKSADHMYENLPDDKVIIDKAALQLLLSLLKDRLQGDEKLLQKLREIMPPSEGIDFSDGIKKEELKRILEKKETILQKI